nr:hypothetical protein CFP56_36276 [Quercus suber]
MLAHSLISSRPSLAKIRGGIFVYFFFSREIHPSGRQPSPTQKRRTADGSDLPPFFPKTGTGERGHELLENGRGEGYCPWNMAPRMLGNRGVTGRGCFAQDGGIVSLLFLLLGGERGGTRG